MAKRENNTYDVMEVSNGFIVRTGRIDHATYHDPETIFVFATAQEVGEFIADRSNDEMKDERFR